MRKMKGFKRVTAMLLAMVMVLCTVNLPSLAAAGDSVDNPIDMGLSYGGGHAGACLLNSTAIATPAEGAPEIGFSKVDEDSKFTYNGTDLTSNLRMNMFGLYLDTNEMVGQASAAAGDLIQISGVWKRNDDNKYYNFGNTQYTWDGTTWAEVTDLVLTKYIGHGTALTFKTDKIDLISGNAEYAFSKVGDKGVFKYNGTDCTNVPRMNQYGLYTDTNEMAGRAAQDGDSIEVGGLWKYSADNKVYNIRTALYKFNASITNWDDHSPIVAEKIKLTPSTNYNATLTFTTDKIANTTNTEPVFEKVDENSIFTYNGTASPGVLRMTQWGLFLNVAEMTGVSGKVAVAGDKIVLSGVWKYTGDGHYYDFGTVEYVFNGGTWEKVEPVVPEAITLTPSTNYNATLTFTTDKIANTTSAEPTFTKVDDNSIFTYNGVVSAGVLRMTAWGLYLNVAEMTGVSGKVAANGDKIVLSGIWKYTGDGKYYDFGTVKYEFNGSNWVIEQPIVPEDAVLTPNLVGMNHVITFNVDKIPNTSVSGEPEFQKVDESSVFTYNGVDSLRMPRMTAAYGMYMEVKDMTGVAGQVAQLGDTVVLSGLWKYTGDGKYYNIGTHEYRWNGSQWAVVEEIVPEDATLTPFYTTMNHVLTFYVDKIPGSSVSGEPDFQKVDSTSICTYNGVDSSRLPRMTAAYGLYMQVDQMTNNAQSVAVLGDTIELSGLWKYTGDGKYYNLGSHKWTFNGTKWINVKDLVSEPITLTPSTNYNETLTFTTDKIANPAAGGAEPEFAKINANSVFTYNGANAQGTLRMTQFGLFCNVSAMTGGTQSVAVAGDIIVIGGIWQYNNDKFYDFGTVTYKFDGTSWKDPNAVDTTPANIDTGITSVYIWDQSGKLIIQPSVSDYANATGDVGFTGTEIDKLKEYNLFDKIKVSTETETKTLGELIATNEFYYNLWGTTAIVLDMLDTFNGTTVTRIEIEKGCEFPAYAYTHGGAAAKTSYVTTEDMTYVFSSLAEGTSNATYERYYPTVLNDTKVKNVHVRVGRLLLFLSEHDYGAVAGTTPVDTTKLDIYNILNNVYVSNGTETKALKDVVTAETPYYNMWGETGSIAYTLATGWDGTNITSVLVKEGAEFPAYAYTSGQTTDRVKFVTSQDVEFRTTTENLGAENITWTAAEPRTEETIVTAVWSGHNGNLVTFQLSESDYEGLATNAIGDKHTAYNYLDMIQVYNTSGECKPLKEVFAGQKYYNLWGIGSSVSLDFTGEGYTLDNVVRIVIPAGTTFPSYAYTGGTPWDGTYVGGTRSALAGYEVTHELVFEKGTDTFTAGDFSGIDWTNISTGASNVPADANGDGKVSAVDLITMKKYLDNGYRLNETADCNVDKTVDIEDFDILVEVILGRILHNYEKESNTLPTFTSSDKELDLFLNDFFKRHIGYNDYLDGNMTVTQYAVGDPVWQEGMFNFNWNTIATTWFDSTDSGLGFDRTEGIKEYLDKVVVDRFGYVWDGTDKQEDPKNNVDGAQHAMGWTFPNVLQGNHEGKAHYWEFNVDGNPNKNTLNADPNTIYDMETEWEGTGTLTTSEGLLSQTVSNVDKAVFSVQKSPTLGIRSALYETEYAPWLAIDLRMTGIDHPENIEDIKIVWQRSGSIYDTTDYEVNVSEIVAMNYEFTSDYSHTLWLPMFTQRTWAAETNNTIKIYELRVEVTAKAGTTFSGTVALNYIRPWFDTRHSDNNGNYIEALRQYYTMTGDVEFLQEHITDARRAMNFYMKMYNTEKHLINHSYLYGHNGSKTELHNSMGNGYWDVYYTPVYDCQTNIYFYEALGHMIFMENALINKGVATPSTSEAAVDVAYIGNETIGKQQYTWTTNDLQTVANDVLAAMRTEFWNADTGRYYMGVDNSGNKQDYGFLALNLEVLNARIATEEQATQIAAWLDSNHDKIYKYGFAPISNTEESPIVNGQRDIYQCVVNQQLTDVVNMEFGESVQYGGAIMYTSFYDLMARLKMFSTDNAYNRFTEIKDWYIDGPLAYAEANPDTTKGKNFYTKYFESIGIQTQSGNQAGKGNGAVGVDAEFTESALLAAFVPYGFFGFTNTDGMTASFEPNLPTNLDFWKIENMQFHNLVYDITIYEDAVRIDSVREKADSHNKDGHVHNVTFILDCPEGKNVYVNDVLAENVTTNEDGKAVVTVPFTDVMVEVK